MSPFDVKKALFNRNFFRFTGPPENWLTAIKFMTWGLERKYLDLWKRIRQGDVFLMHSTANSLYVKRPVSSIVGVGVVGGQFKIDENVLWIQEIKNQSSQWPLRVPFSEVYLSNVNMPTAEGWLAPGMGADEKIPGLIVTLLQDAVPLRTFTGRPFPAMGSWSRVGNDHVEKFFSFGALILYDEFYSEQMVKDESDDFEQIKVADDSIRIVPSLRFLEGSMVKARKIEKPFSRFERDNTILERAEENHQLLLDLAIGFLKKRGFDT